MTTSPDIVLDRPDSRRLAEAFRDLPKKGSAALQCDMSQLQTTLRNCEQAGFFALQISPARDFKTARVSAWKGNTGPCYETGRSAEYHGGALAVLDDDHHFIFGSMRVCEKTGGVYRLPPYAPFIEVTEASPELLAKLEADPVPFNCDTFEKDSAALMAKLSTVTKTSSADLHDILYPGPFRLLVLDDGSVIRRGIPVRIPADMAAKLSASDGLLALPAGSNQASLPEKYQDIYPTRGAGAVLDDVHIQISEMEKRTLHEFDARIFASYLPELLEQIRRMIERNAPYVVFSGSDPADPLGCCPSEQVAQANRLVTAGVLSKYAPPTPADACATTFFACAGEIELVNGEPQFSRNQTLRSKISAMLP